MDKIKIQRKEKVKEKHIEKRITIISQSNVKGTGKERM